MLTNLSEPYDICNGSIAALVVTCYPHILSNLPTPPQTWGYCRQYQRVRHPARSDVRRVDSLLGLYARFIHIREFKSYLTSLIFQNQGQSPIIIFWTRITRAIRLSMIASSLLRILWKVLLAKLSIEYDWYEMFCRNNLFFNTRTAPDSRACRNGIFVSVKCC